MFGASSTNHVERHLEAKHPTMSSNFQKAKNNLYSLEQLEKDIAAAEDKVLQRIEKNKANTDKFFRFVDRGLEHKLQCDLEILLWAIANGVSRSSLNCPIFDLYLRHAGATPVANRHDLGQIHLFQLDALVKKEIRRQLLPLNSVCLFSDGWSDRLRRFWIDLGLAFMVSGPGGWLIEVIDLDLIPIPGQVTGDVIETCVKESVDEFVPSDCLIATSTNDGGGDERKAAFQLVQGGNDWYCVAHRVQLCIGDCLDHSKARPPEDCAPFRNLIQKAHDLVVFVNGHRNTLQRFSELAARKREVPPPHSLSR